MAEIDLSLTEFAVLGLLSEEPRHGFAVSRELEPGAALELLIDKMKSTRSNNQFLQQIQKSNLQT